MIQKKELCKKCQPVRGICPLPALRTEAAQLKVKTKNLPAAIRGMRKNADQEAKNRLTQTLKSAREQLDTIQARINSLPAECQEP